MKHQINETHLGTEATPEEAVKMAKLLTEAGYPSEYTQTSGGDTFYTDDDGSIREIPDSVWFKALDQLE